MIANYKTNKDQKRDSGFVGHIIYINASKQYKVLEL